MEPQPAPVVAPPSTTRRGASVATGCLVAAVLVTLATAGAVGGWWWYSEQERARALAHQQKVAEAEFGPVLEKMAEATKSPPQSYDVDRTVRVIHEVDLALRESNSFKEFLARAASEDYRGVAPEVLEGRRKVMDVLMRLYARQAETADQQALWDAPRKFLLQNLSVVDANAGASAGEGVVPSGSVDLGVRIDGQRARELLDDIEREHRARVDLIRDVREMENELVSAMVEYSVAFHKYLEEWDRLCILRDRAYLAVANGDWTSAKLNAESAVAQAPHDKEAHLLLALALIEGGGQEDWDRAAAVLSAFLEEHPDSSAPALLLAGVLAAKQNNLDTARLNLQQAAAYYPRQAKELTDLLNPYRARAYLRKTREGRYILQLYQGTMLGAGYFSPDLQLARLHFVAEDTVSGRKKLMDHFFRRRAEGEWGFILEDLEFCRRFFGDEFGALFIEDAYFDLDLEETMMGGKLTVSVNNRSDRALHNATLLLALQFTDMYPDDYEVMTVGATQAAVLANDETAFGEVDVRSTSNGAEKGIDDIVLERAILVSDEAVAWVDVPEHRFAETMKLRKAAADTTRGAAAGPAARLQDRALDAAGQAAVELDLGIGADDVLIKLPSDTLLLNPVFRLTYAGAELTPAEDTLADGRVHLRFENVENFDDLKNPFALHVLGTSRTMELTFAPVDGVHYGLQVARWVASSGDN
jgi:hypothetical protein